MIVAHAIGLLIFVPRPLKWRLAAVFVPIAVLWIPMLLFAMRRSDAISWIPPTTPQLIADSAVAIFGGPLLLGMVLVMLAIGMRRDHPAIWLIVPIVGTLAITYLVQPVLQPKYVIAVLPAAAIILARNRPVAIAVLLAVSLVGVGNWYAFGEKDDWRGAAAWVTSELRPTDGIVFEPSFLRPAFDYYAGDVDPLDRSANIETRDRVWLVQGHIPYDQVSEAVKEELSGFEVVEARDFGPDMVRITLMERSTGPP